VQRQASQGMTGELRAAMGSVGMWSQRHSPLAIHSGSVWVKGVRAEQRTGPRR
jgi:hypothetical protein